MRVWQASAHFQAAILASLTLLKRANRLHSDKALIKVRPTLTAECAQGKSARKREAAKQMMPLE